MEKGIDLRDRSMTLLQYALDSAKNISDNLMSQTNNIVIWGAGNTTELNKETIMKENLTPVFFVDSDCKKWGNFKWGVEIIPPKEIKKRCFNPIVLISSANPKTCCEIVEWLTSEGIPNYYMIDAVIWGRHSKELISVYNILESQYSKELFVELILSRLEGKEISEKYITSNQYFAEKEFRIRDSREVFVDCGAYVGDTVEQFIYVKEGVFGEIYAFEPESGNANALSKRVERLNYEWNIEKNKIHIINGAVGKKDDSLFVINDIEGLGAKVTNITSEHQIKMYAIDSFFENVPVGFLKADVEGYESDVLEGAAATIKKHTPLLAICIYHQSSDIYKIPLLIKKLNASYHLNIAHHYYNYTETVLYAHK